MIEKILTRWWVFFFENNLKYFSKTFGILGFYSYISRVIRDNPKPLKYERFRFLHRLRLL